MEKLIAACGLNCSECGAYKATMANDDALRAKVAADWTVAYNFNFTAGMINCHGCFATDGVQIGHCSQCEMRKCAVGRGVVNCGACADYPCARIVDFQKVCPETADNLKPFTAR
jgi:hypothetical protein